MRGLVTLLAFMCSGAAVAQSGPALHRFDAQSPQLHGFHGYRSPFAGHVSFRPSNYRQVTARAQFMQGYTPDFWMNYTERPLAVEVSRLREAVPTPILPPGSASLDASQPTLIENGAMSPIRSIRIIEPRTLPVARRTEPGRRSPPVVRAIQRNDSGPLFPLPY